MTAIYWANQVPETNSGSSINRVNTANDAFIDPGYSDADVGHDLGGAAHPISLGNISECWFSFTMGNVNANASEGSTVTIADLRTSGGQGIVRIQNTSGPTRKFEYWNGSAWTSIGTLTNTSTLSGRRFDIYCKIHGSSGEFSIYVDYVLQFTLSGNTDFFSATIDGFQINGWGQFNSRVVSNIIIATTDTRKMYVKTFDPTGNSATNTGWTGGFGNVNENNTNLTTTDADSAVSSAGGQNMSYTHASGGNFLTDGNILGVSVAARAKNDGSSADFDLLIRSGGANYTAAHARTITSSFASGFYAKWTTDPATGVAWTASGVDAAEFGMQSKNAGVSSISSLVMSVLIEDNFTQPWESAYPSSNGLGVSVVHANTTAAGYQDVTDAAMVAAGCAPKAVIILTQGLAAGGVVGISQLAVWMAWNGPRADLTGKFGHRISAVDASNSSSTSRGYTTRRLREWNTVNGGQIILVTGQESIFAKFIKGGVRIQHLVSTSGRDFTYIFLWGDDYDVYGGFTALGTGTSAIAVTGLGFQPEALIGFCSNNLTQGNQTTQHHSLGMAADDGGGLRQRAHLRTSVSGVAAGPQPIQEIVDTMIGGLLGTGGTLTWGLTLNSLDSDGFTVTPSASTSSSSFNWLAIRHTGTKRFGVMDLSTPTSTGAHAHTGLGFTPQAGIGTICSVEALNTIENDTEKASSMATFAFGPDLTQTANAISENAASDPSACKSYTDTTNGIRLGTNDSLVAAVVGAVTDLNSDGMTATYSAVLGTAKLGFMLAWEGVTQDSNSEHSNSHTNDPPPETSNSLDSNSNSNDPVGGLRAGMIFVVM